METVIVSYNNVRIEIHLDKLEKGGWKADFTLTEKFGKPEAVSTSYDRPPGFSTRDAAKHDAEQEAQRIIDKKLLAVKKQKERDGDA